MFNKRSSASSSKARSSTAQQSQNTHASLSTGQGSTLGDTSVVIPHIKVIDNLRILPKYTAALGRSKDELVPIEDLDAIQLELETLLSNVALRNRILKLEFETIEKEDKRSSDRSKTKHDHVPSHKIEKQPISPGKRKRSLNLEDKKTKTPQSKLFKQKNAQSHSPAQSILTDDSMEAVAHQQQQHPHYSQTHLPKKDKRISMPKNDTPNKFWLSVEPYCMPLTNDDLKLLDDLLEQYSGTLIPSIPELGPHYSQIWATEDIKEEQDNSSITAKSKNYKINPSNSEINGLLKKSEKFIGEGVTGPLTQRLVSALIDENLMVDGLSNADSNSSSENTTNSTSTLRSLSLMKNGISIEKRMKKELIEQGILDPDDFPKGQEDEILSEIKRVTNELRAITEFNSNELKRLQSAGKLELKRLEIKRKLDSVDQEIIEMCKKVTVAKQKRRTLTIEEQDEIYRLTQEQRKLSDQLESIPAPGACHTD